MQWSTAASPSSQASWTPGPGPSWLACSRPPQPGGRAGGQDRPGLVGVEGAPLAEHVDPPGVRRARLEHRPGHEVDVAGRVVGVLRRHDVRAEERGLGGEPRGDRERPRLVARR